MLVRLDIRALTRLFVGALVVAVAVPASAQDEQERVAVAWVEALNGGLDAMATLRASHYAEPEASGWRDTVTRLREEWGTLEVYGMMIENTNEVMVGVSAENAGRMRLIFAFDNANKVVGVRISEGGPGGGDNPIPPLELPEDGANATERIEVYLRELEQEGLLSGSVLLSRGGEIWFEGAYGLASREFNVPNTPNTRFDVGSFNKDYTRLAIMQLLEGDQLALTDKVGQYLPEYPNDRVRDEVTIEQLLHHRSGLGDYFTREYLETPMGVLRDIDDYIPIWGPKPLEYDPGTREQYSNFGYTVLGAIIEKITGMSYPEYVQANIFEPAGMDATGFFATDGIEPNVAVGYTYMDRTGRRSETLRKNIYHEPVLGGPWGKSYSTARDLHRFFEALFSNELLSAEFSWMLDGWTGSTALAGGGPGLSAILLIDGGKAVIVLANHDEPGAEQIGSRLLEALR